MVFDARGRAVAGTQGLSASAVARLAKQFSAAEVGGNARLWAGAVRRTGGAVARVSATRMAANESTNWKTLEASAARYRRDNAVTFFQVGTRRWMETRAKSASPKSPRSVQWTTVRGAERITLALTWPDAALDKIGVEAKRWLRDLP